MSLGNAIVGAVLRSPFHRVLSGSTMLVRYRGRRSGAAHVLPVQYAAAGDDLVVLVSRSARKSWWRNFRADHPGEVLVRGAWRPVVGRALVGATDPGAVAPLLDAYLERFPKAVRLIEDGGLNDLVDHAVVVRFHPARPQAAAG